MQVIYTLYRGWRRVWRSFARWCLQDGSSGAYRRDEGTRIIEVLRCVAGGFKECPRIRVYARVADGPLPLIMEGILFDMTEGVGDWDDEMYMLHVFDVRSMEKRIFNIFDVVVSVRYPRFPEEGWVPLAPLNLRRRRNRG